MKKNEVGKVLKIVGVLAIIFGTIGSIVMGFTTVHNPMDEMLGFVSPQTITFNFGQVLPGIFSSVIAGAILIGISEIIYILDEQRENSRRLCKRFGIMPVENDKYAPAKNAIDNRFRQTQQAGAQNHQQNNFQPQNGQPQSSQTQNGQLQNGQLQNGQPQNDQAQNDQPQKGQAQNDQLQGESSIKD